jgi:hypothetical protein
MEQIHSLYSTTTNALLIAETMTGYNCIRWDDPTNEFDHNKYLKDNYLSMTNEAMGKHLGRTADAVRKQLNVLNLKRPKKTEVRRHEKSARKNFFSNLKASEERRRELKRIQKKLEKKNRNADKERKFANKLLGQPKTLTLTEPKGKMDKVPVIIDHRTTVYCYPHQVQATIQKFAKHVIPK